MSETPSVFIVGDAHGHIHFHTTAHARRITLSEAQAVVRIVNAHDALLNALYESMADCPRPCDECAEQGECLTPKALAALKPAEPEKAECEHEWEVIDSMMGEMSEGRREDVVCRKCQMPGERTVETGEVYWPAT